MDFGECHKHKEKGVKLDFFCEVCKIPICIYCKINGNHSKGKNAEHSLMKIED